jgi:hypothetical protein
MELSMYESDDDIESYVDRLFREAPDRRADAHESISILSQRTAASSSLARSTDDQRVAHSC